MSDFDDALSAAFIRGSRDKLFCLHHRARGNSVGQVLCVPPFAEEANRCRVMMNLAARALAAVGYDVAIVDLYGTGDSAGEFVDAAVDVWTDDVHKALGVLGRSREPLILWGVRFGALVAASALAKSEANIHRLILWQPVVSGKTMFTQYLRLRVASSQALTGQQETTAELRERLRGGETLDVAGYQISPRLAAGLDAAALGDLDLPAGLRIDWFERTDEPKGHLPPAVNRAIDALGGQVKSVNPHPYHGPAFWQLHERVLAPELVDSFVEVMKTP